MNTWSYPPRNRIAAPLALFTILALGGPADLLGQRTEPDRAEELSVEERLEEMRERYERRIDELERRLSELETRLGTEARPETRLEAEEEAVEEDLEELRRAAKEAVEEPAPAAIGEPAGPTVGHERNLNRFNPEISFTGDVVGVATDGAQDFDPREVELDMQSTLDPFSTTKLTLAFSPEEGVDIEEAYVTYSGLAPGLGLRAGKMRQTFGVLNRWHLHALPQPTFPLVLTEYFGEEGLAQTGLSAEWLLPAGWADTNELTVQLTDGSADLFGGDDFESLSALAHLKNYWDLSESTYLEWGLSGLAGETEGDLTNSVLGADLTLHWQPPARAKYQELTWRSEVLRSDREDVVGDPVEAWGGYSYLQGLLRRNLYAGVRYDLVEDPLLENLERWAVTPYVSWWQSEFVRLRAAWTHLEEELAGAASESDDRFTLQLTWSAGPHKHEKY